MAVPEAVSRTAVLADVSRERDRQDKLFGRDQLLAMQPAVVFPMLVARVGDAGEAMGNRDVRKLRDQCVRVAAYAVVMAQAIDRAHG